MIKTIGGFLKDNAKLEIFMSIILLIAVTAIACNMDKVAKKNHETENKTEKESNGRVIVIDPGHGGSDPGKVGVNGAKEKDINLAIAKALQATLVKDGFEVVMTRSGDCNLSEGAKFSKIGDLNARCKTINDTYATNNKCILVSIHQNSFKSESVHGAQCFYYQRSDKSRELAELIQNKLNKSINTEKAKRPKPNDSYYMLINTKCPGVIIECGFLSNINEAEKLATPKYQNYLAEIIKTCINEYLDVE